MFRPTTSTFVEIIGFTEVEAWEGCYLYFDIMNGVWIRSGKVSGEGRSFLIRHEEHAGIRKPNSENAKNPGANLFYLRNPDEDCDVSRHRPGLVKCHFQDLKQYVGLGFDRSDAAAVEAICGSAIFDWTAEMLQAINYRSFNNSPSLKDKQLHMVGYLFEIVDDLMIAHKDNASESTGYEATGLRTDFQ